MEKIKYIFSSLLIVIILFNVSIAQNKNTTKSDSVKKGIDSTRNSNLENETKGILISDSLRVLDSIKMEGLKKELEKFKSSEDNLQKRQLLEEINKIKASDSIKRAVMKTKIDSLKSINPGFPVVLRYDTLFVIYNGVGSFSALDRASAISIKILSIAKKNDYDSTKLIVKKSAYTEIFYENTAILSLLNEDAIWNGTDEVLLANIYKDKINLSIHNYKNETSLTSWIIRAAKVLIILVLLIAVLKGISWINQKIRAKVKSLEGNVLKGFKIKTYQLLDPGKQVNAVLFLVKMIHWFLVLLSIYIALLLLFGVFPETKNIADTLLQYILNPVKKVVRGFIGFIPNLFAIIVIVIITRYLTKFINYIGSEIQSGNLTIKGFYPDWTRPTISIIKVVLYAFMFIVIFPYLPGSDSPIFQGVSVFLGVLFSLGSTSAISNMIAGLVITYMRPFKIGDRVKIGDITGDVIEKGILVTRVRTIKNEDITIPNSTILSGHTTNFTTSSEELGLILYTTITIGYDAPWKTVHDLLINAALSTNGIDTTKTPFVLQTSLDDFYVSYQINAYTNLASKQAVIYSELHKNIQDKFNEAGVEIMSPHYKALRDGNLVTIPLNYLPKDYKTPDFNVKLNKE